MIAPLITKLQNCTNSSELQSIYSEILSEYEKLNFPNPELKSKSKGLLTSTIDLYINEFDVNRENNKRFLDALHIMDSLQI